MRSLSARTCISLALTLLLLKAPLAVRGIAVALSAVSLGTTVALTLAARSGEVVIAVEAGIGRVIYIGLDPVVFGGDADGELIVDDR